MEIPDELVRDIRILAAHEGKKLKEIVEEALRSRLEERAQSERSSIRDVEPVSVGRVFPFDEEAEDTFDEMINGRESRY